MDNLDIQELIAEADRNIANKLLPAKSRQRYEGVCVCVCVCARARVWVQMSFISLSSQIMPHFVTKFVHDTF